MKVSLLKIYRKNLKCLFLCYNSPSSKRISFPLWIKKIRSTRCFLFPKATLINPKMEEVQQNILK